MTEQCSLARYEWRCGVGAAEALNRTYAKRIPINNVTRLVMVMVG